MSWGLMGGLMGVMELEGWRKGPWTAEEDKLLIDYVRLHGEGRWNSVARLAGLKRNGKSCRLRWVNYLRPDLKRGHITAHEESIILELHNRWGNRWSTIARSLPGRTDNEIKNYWRTHFKKKVKPASDGSEKLKIRLLKRQQFQQQQLQLMQQEELNYQLASMEESYNYTSYKPFTMPQVGLIRPASDMSTSSTMQTLSGSSHDQEEQLSYFNSMINSNNVSSSSILEPSNEGMIMWDGLFLDDVHASNLASAETRAGLPNLATPFC